MIVSHSLNLTCLNKDCAAQRLATDRIGSALGFSWGICDVVIGN